MTANAQESIVNQNLEQEKVDAISQQEKVDTKLPENQQKIEKNEDPNEDPNWRSFREARKRDRAERQEAERRAAEKAAEVEALKRAMEAAFESRAPVQQPQASQGYQYLQEETEDEKIEKKVQAALLAREQQYRKEQAEIERREYPQRLQKTYADFNNVISQENLDYLDYHYPEVSRPLQRLQDDYEKWSDIYLAVKKFVPNHNAVRRDSEKAVQNMNKPKSMSSHSMTQPQAVSNAAIISQDKKAANWERMQRAMKGLS